jgi:hypothetical protein
MFPLAAPCHRRPRALRLAAAGILPVAIAAAVAAPAASAGVVTKTLPARERAAARNAPFQRIEREATALPLPRVRTNTTRSLTSVGPHGPQVQIAGSRPTVSSTSAAAPAPAHAAAAEDGAWPGAFGAAPAEEVGAWVNGSGGRYDWSHDLAAVVVSPNSSG